MIRLHRLGAVALAAAGVLGATHARAGEPGGTADQGLSLAPNVPLYAQESQTAEARRPLMRLLDTVGVARPLEDARIRLYGWAEAGYTYNFIDPAGDLNLGRVFDIEHADPVFNQLDLNIERPVELSDSNWDVGFRIEMLYGGDARFIHANGLFDNQDFFDGPDNQFDIVQAYADVNVPVGNGLRVRAGKFLFFKQINPNASVFYSHSYTFGAALPFTLTGITGYYEINEQWSFETGISRGWGQALEDNNDVIDVLGRLTYRPNDRTSFSVLAITGPELEDNNDDFRTAIDFVARHELTDDFTVLLDVVWGHQQNAPETNTVEDPASPGDTGDATWYGVAGYGVYEINDMLAAGVRLEWFHDEGGFTTGVDQNLYEATVGLTITPFPQDEIGQNLKIRPEVRYDLSDEDFFDGLTQNDQFTAAVDVIFNF